MKSNGRISIFPFILLIKEYENLSFVSSHSNVSDQ